MSQVVSLVNQKGGVGKTTTAIHLAASLSSHHNKKVLVIDADQQSNATDTLFINGEVPKFQWHLYNILTDQEVNMTRVWARYNDEENPFSSRLEGLYIIPSEIGLGRVEREFAAKVGAANVLNRKLDKKFRSHFDFIIIDCPPSMGLMTANALTASDIALIPVTPDWYAQYGIKLLFDFIKEVRLECNEQLKILGAVITMADRRTNILDITREDLSEIFKDKLFENIVGQNTDINKALMQQKTIFEYRPSAKGAKEYREVTNEFVKRIEQYG